MSLPEPVLDLAADVVPEAEDHGKLAFAYAHGALLSGFGAEDELGMVCVWDHEEIPVGAPERASHVTQNQFDQMLGSLRTGPGWTDAARIPLSDIAAFAYGVLLADDDGAGTSARGMVGEFPETLAERSAKALLAERDTVAAELAALDDHWARADLLSQAVYRGYVAWFAAAEHYFPGPKRRREYAEHFGMGDEVPQRERQLWESDSSDALRRNYELFVDRILDEA